MENGIGDPNFVLRRFVVPLASLIENIVPPSFGQSRSCDFAEEVANRRSGIAVVASTRPGKGAPERLERMTCAIRHRGPDDCVFFQNEFIALGHRASA
jgi:hypothetical protein